MKDAFVKNPLSAQSAITSSITRAFMDGLESIPSHLLNHACLSMAALARHLSDKFEAAGLPPLKGTLALARAGHLYETARELKLFVQGINANTLNRYQHLIDEAKDLISVGRTKEAIKLLKARVKAPHRALVAVAAGIELPNPDYWIFTDRQILDLCAGVPSLTALKNRLLGPRNRASNTQATINARFKQYADIDSVTALIRQHSITSQKEWYAFAVANKELLRTLRIPTGLPAVYKKLGTWRGWGALWAKQDEQA